MKKRFLLVSSILLLLVSGDLSAQNSHKQKVRISGTRLTYPLVQKWISEFNAAHPNIQVEIAAPKTSADSIDISLNTFTITQAEAKAGKSVVWVNRFSQLPITNSRNPQLTKYRETGISNRALKAIFFQQDSASAVTASAASNPYGIKVYTRDVPACAAVSFSKSFGENAKQIKGVGVKGDDRTLLNAVKNDPNAISFNNLGFVYNNKTRKVTDSIAVIPVDLNDNGKLDKAENVYGTLDEVIAYLEKTSDTKLAIDNVSASYSKQASPAAILFLEWVLNTGQKYNHEYGFINQEKATLETQKRLLDASKASNK